MDVGYKIPNTMHSNTNIGWYACSMERQGSCILYLWQQAVTVSVTGDEFHYITTTARSLDHQQHYNNFNIVLLLICWPCSFIPLVLLLLMLFFYCTTLLPLLLLLLL